MTITTWYQSTTDRLRKSSALTHPTLLAFKREAKALKRKEPSLSLMQAQEKVAKVHGFNHWHHAAQLAKKHWAPSKDTYAMIWKSDRQELPFHARWVGYDELSNVHLGQSRSTQCIHTIVVGSQIGHRLLKHWLPQHQQQKTPWMLWIKEKDWFNHQFDEETLSLVVHLSATPLSIASSISLYWSSLEEFGSWLNALRLPIASSNPQKKLVPRLLEWLWAISEGSPRTGPVLAHYLRSPQLETFEEWSSHQHEVLAVASELEPLLCSADPFVQPDKPTQLMSILEWCSSEHGTILIDDDSKMYESTRKIIKAWYQMHLHMKFKSGADAQARSAFLKMPPSSPRKTLTAAWYLFNMEDPTFAMMASQVRALGISLTHIYDKDLAIQDKPLNDFILANSNTHITQSKENAEVAILQHFAANIEIPVVIRE